MEQCVVEIVRTYGELLNHRIRGHLEPFQRATAASPDPDPETPLFGPASAPVEADCVGEPALPSSVHEDSAQPLRRSTRERRPPERFKDFILS